MKKLINGIIEFRKNLLPAQREKFARLALGQSPDALFIGCSDSRVAVNVLGTLNVSNIIVCGHSECGAMHALANGRDKLKDKNLLSWLRHGEKGLEDLNSYW